ncbi:MAG TPA: metal-dependent hydrolase [Aliiroseovarius sp.]|nr:metal-dependent hydrolase [Aliiroseovarius sp.]
MKRVSYNIRKAIGLDRRRKPGRILDVINALEGDIVVLQEADKRLGARPPALPLSLLSAHSDFTPAPLGQNGISLGYHGNTILLRKGLGLVSARPIPLPGLEPRGAVEVEVTGGLRVVGVHLGLMRRHRRLQLAALSAALDDRTGPTAILGDFNEWSPVQGLEALGQRFTIYSPGRSFHAARPVAALDRIALSPGIELCAAGVEQGPLARIASDHLPIWARISITDAPDDFSR